jgi:periplasmic protein TonB
LQLLLLDPQPKHFAPMKKMYLSLCLLLSVAASAQTSTIQVVSENKLTTDSTVIFEKVEREAEFPGGLPAWRTYLMENLRADAPFKEIPKKTKHFEQTAMVQFIVGKDGSISDVKVINEVLSSIRKESIRVIKNSGKWIPAQQNGRPVKAYRKQPITFVVDVE